MAEREVEDLIETVRKLEERNDQNEQKFLAERQEWERRLEEMERLVQRLSATEQPAAPQDHAPAVVPPVNPQPADPLPAPAVPQDLAPAAVPPLNQQPADQAQAPADVHTPVQEPSHQVQENVPMAAATPRTISVPINDPVLSDRIAVEVSHVIRSEGPAYSTRVKPFSGLKRGGEASYEEWAHQCEFILNDDAISERVKRMKITSTLLSPALDVIRSMGQTDSQGIFNAISELYGYSSNGTRLLQDFFKMSRSHSESATEYVQRLNVHMAKVVKKGGLRRDQADDTLLSHFKSTCSSPQIQQLLHGRYGGSTAPSIHVLLKEVREAEETFDQASSLREPQPRRARTQAHTTDTSPMQDLQKQLSQMQAQMNRLDRALNARERERPRNRSVFHQQPRNPSGLQRFCYKCGGTDGHFKYNCPNEANPSMVYQRLNPNNNSQASNPNRSQATSSNHLNGQGSLPRGGQGPNNQ